MKNVQDLVEWMLGGSGSGSCSVAGLVINGVKFQDFAAVGLVEIMRAVVCKTLQGYRLEIFTVVTVWSVQ